MITFPPISFTSTLLQRQILGTVLFFAFLTAPILIAITLPHSSNSPILFLSLHLLFSLAILLQPSDLSLFSQPITSCLTLLLPLSILYSLVFLFDYFYQYFKFPVLHVLLHQLSCKATACEQPSQPLQFRQQRLTEKGKEITDLLRKRYSPFQAKGYSAHNSHLLWILLVSLIPLPPLSARFSSQTMRSYVFLFK